MATAYESDGRETPFMSHPPAGKATDNLSVDSSPNHVTCMPAASFYSKTLCCNNSTEETLKPDETNAVSSSNTANSSNELENEESNSNIVSILSEYYSYIEDIRQELQKQNTPIEQIVRSLQYLPCLMNGHNRQQVFSQSSSIVKAPDTNQLLMNLNNVSSWYNYGLIQHLSVAILSTDMQAVSRQPDRKFVDHEYFKTLESHKSDLLSMLPSISSGPQLHEDFEEVCITVSRNCKEFTLKNVLNIHRHIANVLGLRMFIVLLQGVSQKEDQLSELVFWIPKSVAASAITSAYENKAKLPFMNIDKIETQYESITAQVGISNGADTRESGYGTTTQSNMGDDENGGISSSSSDKTVDEEDEVFITQVSPDESSLLDRTSNDLISDMSFDSSNMTPQIIMSNTPILVPPTEYTGNIVITSPPNSSCTSLLKLATNSSLTPTSNGGKQINLDSEILEEIDRQNSISSPLEKSMVDDPDAPYVAMNPAVTPISDSVHSNSSVVRSNSSPVSQSHSQRHYTVASPNKLNPHYQTPPSNKPAHTLSLPQRNPPKRTASYHHYKNVPISYVRVPYENRVADSFNYKIGPPKPSGFIKRILLRSSDVHPANLQMIVISSQKVGDGQAGQLMVESGDRVTALYALKDNIVVKKSTGQIGKIPYSSCRASKAHYGGNSKVIKYASMKLYGISTLCIEPSTGNHVASPPLTINMIIIKSYSSTQKEELTVKVGEQLSVLFSDENWVFGRLKDGKSGFIPRDNCRLSRKSVNILSLSGWLIPSLSFQSDFVFNLQAPPPNYLLMHYLFPNKEMGYIVMVTQTYTPPGTQAMIRKGVCVKTIYKEEHFKYVATISGSAFWIPAPFTYPAPRIRSLPVNLTKPRLATPIVPTPLYSSPTPRDRSATTSISGISETKKKVSFAASVVKTVIRESMGSNPELNTLFSSSWEQSNNPYSVVSPTRRIGSNENIPVFVMFNDSPIPSTFCGCFKF